MISDAESQDCRSSVGKLFDFDDGRRVDSEIAGDVGTLDEVFRPQILDALQFATGQLDNRPFHEMRRVVNLLTTTTTTAHRRW